MGCPYSTETGTVSILQTCGKFEAVQEAGCGWLWCPGCYESVAGTVSLRTRQHNIICSTKTLDNVFVSIMVSVQFRVKRGLEKEAFYELYNPTSQIESYVFDSLRAEVPQFTLDDIFVVKDKLSSAVQSTVKEAMTSFGYEIIATPITDIDPDSNVKHAMNEMNKQTRLKRAAEERGEGEKILRIKTAEAKAAEIRIQAEAESDASELAGQGLSRQRQAIVDGLQKSVAAFTSEVKGTDPSTVMNMIMVTQYFDALKDIGSNNKSSTVFIPTSPATVGDLATQIRQGLMEGNSIGTK